MIAGSFVLITIINNHSNITADGCQVRFFERLVAGATSRVRTRGPYRRAAPATTINRTRSSDQTHKLRNPWAAQLADHPLLNRWPVPRRLLANPALIHRLGGQLVARVR